MKFLTPQWFIDWWADKKEVVYVLGGFVGYSAICVAIGAWIW